jgi:hypothetical protein
MTLMEHFDNFSFPTSQKFGEGVIISSNIQAYEKQHLVTEGSRTHTFIL